MRKKISLPRIIKINWVKGLTISVVFNNGESRVIDFQKVFKSLKIDEKSPASLLLDPDEFFKVEIQNNTLSWCNVEQYITLKNKEKLKVPFEIGADILLKYSHSENSDLQLRIGRLIRESRLKSGLTQLELATRSGTTRNYISRIENDRSDFELATLKKIVETGLGKQLEIVIK
jgi:DNA-binding XRE family transcriptional regulator